MQQTRGKPLSDAGKIYFDPVRMVWYNTTESEIQEGTIA
jgi:hypothetical protein